MARPTNKTPAKPAAKAARPATSSAKASIKKDGAAKAPAKKPAAPATKPVKPAAKPVKKVAAAAKPVKPPAQGKDAAPKPAKKVAAKAAVAPAKPPAKKTAGTPAPATESRVVAKKPAAAAKPAASAKVAPAPEAAKPERKQPPLTPKERDTLRQELEAQRVILERELEDLDLGSLHVAQSELSGEVSFDEEYADAGTFTFERERDLSLSNNIRDLMDKVDTALRKITDGSYGTCERCGNTINKDRLKALPYSVLCITCKQREERIR